MEVQYNDVAVILTDEEVDDLFSVAWPMSRNWSPEFRLVHGQYEVDWYKTDDGPEADDTEGLEPTTDIIVKTRIQEAWSRIICGGSNLHDEYVNMLRPDRNGDADYDSIAADAVIQVALWDEVIFG